ncbi:hypothetical protein T459_17892 [Capsicum annuum]|uniref:Endonuclease/exonuclease/phosphatase domain-containing protein n=1 Tax=Capsicum annuum TaxID=4072 RepID=A0A2G2ZCV9_CAPAN|nr:hypothetical protein T459_17892 [Capsicum annuum]
MGDFNSILTTEDKKIGSPVQEYEFRDFREFIEECNIAEMLVVGRFFTWINGHVYSRIDKALLSAEWGLNMPPTQVQSLAKKKDKLWIVWVHTYYLKGQRPWEAETKKASWIVKKILQAGQWLIATGLDVNEDMGRATYSRQRMYDQLREANRSEVLQGNNILAFRDETESCNKAFLFRMDVSKNLPIPRNDDGLKGMNRGSEILTILESLIDQFREVRVRAPHGFHSEGFLLRRRVSFQLE